MGGYVGVEVLAEALAILVYELLVLALCSSHSTPPDVTDKVIYEWRRPKVLKRGNLQITELELKDTK